MRQLKVRTVRGRSVGDDVEYLLSFTLSDDEMLILGVPERVAIAGSARRGIIIYADENGKKLAKPDESNPNWYLRFQSGRVNARSDRRIEPHVIGYRDISHLGRRAIQTDPLPECFMPDPIPVSAPQLGGFQEPKIEPAPPKPEPIPDGEPDILEKNGHHLFDMLRLQRKLNAYKNRYGLRFDINYDTGDLEIVL